MIRHEVELIGLVFIKKDNKSYYFDSFGGQSDKPTIYHK